MIIYSLFKLPKMKTKFYLIPFFATLFYFQTAAQDGMPDLEFAGSGKTWVIFGDNEDRIQAIAAQPDGTVVVGGYTTNAFNKDFALARFFPNGAPDYNFGYIGKVVTSFDAWDEFVNAIAIQPDGNILAAGTAEILDNGRDFAIARYTAAGTLDPTFGIGGKVSVYVSDEDDVALALSVQPDGKILMGGFSGHTTLGNKFAMVRLLPDGTRDEDFGWHGISTFSVPLSDAAEAFCMALQPDGKIVLAGRALKGGIYKFAVARFHTSGSPDNGFGYNGGKIIDIGTADDRANAILLQSDGKIILGGSSKQGADDDFTLVRLLPNGDMDGSFGTNGIVITDMVTGNSNKIRSLVMQPDGKIIAVGYCYNGTNNDFALARYDHDGVLDWGFGVNGWLLTDFNGSNDGGFAGAMCPVGANWRIVAAGETDNLSSGVDFALARYITALHVGLIDWAAENQGVLFYPNPIRDEGNLGFTLQKETRMTIRLLDAQGHSLDTFLNDELLPAGEHNQAIFLDPGLPAGTYFLSLSSPEGRMIIRIVH